MIAAGSKEFIHIIKDHGRFWFADASDRRFISTGINHVEPCLMTGQYNIRHTLQTYGEDFIRKDGGFNPDGAGARAWIKKVSADLIGWRFNTLGFHTDPQALDMLRDSFYHVVAIKTARIEVWGKTIERPDIFSEEFSRHADTLIRKTCEKYREEKNLLGYAFADLPEWDIEPSRYPVFPVLHPWVLALAQLPKGHAGKTRWIDVLKENYESAGAAGRVYGLQSAGWDRLEENTDWQDVQDKARAAADSRAMMECIAEKWYALHCGLTRRYDPNHLILGDKLDREDIATLPDYLVPLLQKYCDAVLFQWYADFPEQEAELHSIHQKTGLPILMGDSSFSVQKPQQDYAKGVKMACPELLGRAYYQYLRRLVSLPFILGWHHCGYTEGWVGIEPEHDHTLHGQCGFLDPFGRGDEFTLDCVTAANAKAFDWHEKAAAAIEPAAGE